MAQPPTPPSPSPSPPPRRRFGSGQGNVGPVAGTGPPDGPHAGVGTTASLDQCRPDTGHAEDPPPGRHQTAGVKAGAGVEDRDPVQGLRLGHAADGVTPPRRPRIALGGHDHTHRCLVSDGGHGAQVARRHLGQGGRQVADEAGQDDLGLGVAEAHVELEHLRSRGGEHEAGVEHPAVVDAAAAELGHEGGHSHLGQRLGPGVLHEGHRRVGAHAPGVGPGVAVAHPLEVLGRRQRGDAAPVTQHEQGALDAGEPFLDHDAPPSSAEGPARELGLDVGLRLGPRRRDEDALAGSQPVGLDDPGARLVTQIGAGRSRFVEDLEMSSGDPGRGQHFLHERL